MEWHLKHNGKSEPFVEPENTESTDITPEEKLWQHVLFLFLVDFERAVKRHKRALNGDRKRMWRRVEVFYNTARHEWISEVCDFCGFDHETLMEVMSDIASGHRSVDVVKRTKDR